MHLNIFFFNILTHKYSKDEGNTLRSTRALKFEGVAIKKKKRERERDAPQNKIIHERKFPPYLHYVRFTVQKATDMFIWLV